MQVGQFPFEQNVEMVRSGNIAGAARAGAATVNRVVHGPQHVRMLTHAQIVVGAPDRYFARHTVLASRCSREISGMTLDIGEHPVAAFPVQMVDLLLEETVVVHAGLDERPLRR